MTSYAISYAFSCLPGPAQKRSRSGSDAPRFESNAAVAHPVRLSVFVGLEIGLQWFTNPYKASRPPVPPPPSPSPRGPHESIAHPNVLPPPPPPRVIRRWRETGGCAGRAGPFWRWYRRPPADMPSDAYATRRGAGRPYLTAP